MTSKIPVSECMALQGHWPLLDVRTPDEFQKGHVPGAHNLPLFTNEERAEVGTLYKQVSPQKALLRGLDLVGGKMRGFVEKAQKIAPGRQVMVHCWRGGKRSGSMGWLLDLAGFEVKTVEGGYKAYRNYILDQFAQRKVSCLIIGGFTGSGKTAVLHDLADRGEQIIDLEKLAHHKGSAFGALGELPQPSVEQFENDLFEAFSGIDPNRRVWLENESQSIGRVYVPAGFWRQMNEAPLIHLEVPHADRLERLLEEYGLYDPSSLKYGFEKIRKRLGGQHVKAALESIDSGNLAAAATISLRYYDKAYRHFVERRQTETEAPFYELSLPGIDPGYAAKLLVDLAEKMNL